MSTFDDNPFISRADKERIKKLRKTAEDYIKKYAYDKKSARACLVRLGTHDKDGNLTEHYTSKNDDG